MDEKSITLEAVGNFPFTFYIEKAVPLEEGDELILEGIASTTNVDHDKERMSKDALRAMESAINKDGVPLRVEHQKDSNAIIGQVFKAWVDERNQLHVRARLDKNHPVSPVLHHSMKNGVKMGLSVGGVVKRAMKEFVESVGGLVKTFYDVALQEVSVTPRPANYDSWLVAKSIAKDSKDAEQYSESMGLRREFLLENSQLDYLQAFAKSVPDKAWRKVESPEINKNNDTNMEKDKVKKETEDSETEKAVSRAEFTNLSKAVKDLMGLMSKGFENVGALIVKAMDGSAKDANNPDKAKPEDESPAAKMEGGDAKEQVNPDQAKADDPTQQTAKAEDDEDETKKADDTDETTKAGDTDDTYDMETVNRSIATLKSLEKRIKGVKKTAAETEDETKKADEETDETKKADTEDETTKADDTEDETKKADEEETTTKHHPLDVFVVTVTKMMESVVEKLEKSGRRVLGFEKSFVEDIQNNPEIQAEIAKMVKMPGFKKSVAMGVPYMITKEGKRYALTSAPEKVEKSADEKPQDFKTMYKSKYSSVSPETEE